MLSGHTTCKILFTNLNVNPSIEANTTGYAAIGSAISRDTVEHYHGVASLKTITENGVVTEGFKRVVTGESEANKQYTFSVYLKGSGTVILRFYDDVKGNQDSAQITLSGTWTRYSLTKIFGAASTVRELQVVTDVQQAITYYADALQHELSATASEFTENKISEVVDIGPYDFISFIFPAMNSGHISFQVAAREDGTYVELKTSHDNDIEIYARDGNRAVHHISELIGHRYMKLVSATRQTADRNIEIIWKLRE